MDDSKDSVFHGCVYELTGTVVARTRLAQVQTRQGPRAERGSGHRVPPLTKRVSAIDSFWQKKGQFLQWSFTAYINHTSGQVPSPGGDDQQQTQWYFL